MNRLLSFLSRPRLAGCCASAPGRTAASATLAGLIVPVVAAVAPTPAAAHDLEYVSEHLPEAAMNHRLASLPLWGPMPDRLAWTVQGAYSRTTAGNLSLAGPLTSVGLQYRLGPRWSLTGFGFYDRLNFSGSNDERPLEVRFARTVPLSLPADARFERLGGHASDAGLGLALGYEFASGWLKDWRLTFGATAQRLALGSYSTRYQILSGASAGATGLVDYSGNYWFVSSMVGLSRRYETGDWGLTPHALLALPILRQGVKGRITGAGFDLRGDTADVGAGKHYGDAALVFGFEVEYRPWRAAFDVGALLTQPFTEPAMHKGLDRSLLMSASFRF